MTLRECYESIQGDFDGLVGRVMGEERAERFSMKFLNDQSYAQLMDALGQGDYENAFRAAHTLKGVCANLGFAKLQEVASELTEAMRGGTAPGDSSLVDRTMAEYERTVDALNGYLASKNA